jgi:hypothetical protein
MSGSGHFDPARRRLSRAARPQGPLPDAGTRERRPVEGGDPRPAVARHQARAREGGEGCGHRRGRDPEPGPDRHDRQRGVEGEQAVDGEGERRERGPRARDQIGDPDLRLSAAKAGAAHKRRINSIIQQGVRMMIPPVSSLSVSAHAGGVPATERTPCRSCAPRRSIPYARGFDHAALALALLALPSCWMPSTKTTPARTSGSRCAPSRRRHRACAISRSL